MYSRHSCEANARREREGERTLLRTTRPPYIPAHGGLGLQRGHAHAARCESVLPGYLGPGVSEKRMLSFRTTMFPTVQGYEQPCPLLWASDLRSPFGKRTTRVTRILPRNAQSKVSACHFFEARLGGPVCMMSAFPARNTSCAPLEDYPFSRFLLRSSAPGGFMRSERKQGFPAEPAPVSAYVEISKNLKNLKDLRYS